MTQKNDTEHPHTLESGIQILSTDDIAEFVDNVLIRHERNPAESIGASFWQTRKNIKKFTVMGSADIHEAWGEVRKIHTSDRNDSARVRPVTTFAQRYPNSLGDSSMYNFTGQVKQHQSKHPQSTLQNSFMYTLLLPDFHQLTKYELADARRILGLPKAATVETATVELKDKDESKFMQLSSKQLNEHFVKLDAALKQALADSNTVPSVCPLLPWAKENRAAQAQIEPEPCPVTSIEGLDRILDRRVAHNQRKKTKKSKRSSHLTEIDIEHVIVDGKPMIKILEFRNVATASDLPVGYSTKYPKYFKSQCISGKAGILLYTKLNNGLVVSSTIVQHDLLTRTEFDGIVTAMKQAGQRLTDINKKAKEAKQVRKETIVI